MQIFSDLTTFNFLIIMLIWSFIISIISGLYSHYKPRPMHHWQVALLFITLLIPAGIFYFLKPNDIALFNIIFWAVLSTFIFFSDLKDFISYVREKT